MIHPDSVNSSVCIEPARSEDAEAIVRTHFAAVHQIAASFYPEAVLSSWSPPVTSNRVEQVRQAIESADELFVVARGGDDIIAGFGSIVPKDYELRSLYVHPDFGHCGIGTRLLNALEQMAVERAVPFLEMEASLNAEGFYLRNDFHVVEQQRSTHRLASGEEMACVRMRKQLPSNLGR